METVYNWFGFVMFWLYAFIGCVLVLSVIYEKGLNFWGKISKTPWRMLEYFYYREPFKEWVKDKQRHPKAN